MELSNGQLMLQDLVERQGIPVFNNIPVAINCTAKVCFCLCLKVNQYIVKQNVHFEKQLGLLCSNYLSSVSLQQTFQVPQHFFSNTNILNLLYTRPSTSLPTWLILVKLLNCKKCHSDALPAHREVRWFMFKISQDLYYLSRALFTKPWNYLLVLIYLSVFMIFLTF